ncbi:MAG TPA: CotH kinase family protein, partial [Polyangiaceae bacterium]|nr:CotH kinase family protein [Polyangiaceae bacterium]
MQPFRFWRRSLETNAFGAALVLALGCGATDSTKSPADGQNELAERDPAELYDWDHVPTFELSLPPGEFEHLLATAADEVYTRASLTFDQKPIGDVGLRFKGSVGTLESCFDAQGNLTCPKLSMKLGFDEYVPSTRFFRQKRLNLHSMVRDDTKLHERLAYDLYRSMGIVAPRSAWAVVKVNGESLGLFSMVEQIDGRFTANRWPGAGDGNLYKEAWPLSTDAQYYEDHLETGASQPDAAPHSAYVDFTSALSAGGDDKGRGALGRYMDLEYLSRYMAVDDAILNVDGVTATYTGDDPRYYANHNFYVYQEEQRGFFWLVPWDMDATFNLRGDFELVPRWNGSGADCTSRYTVWGAARVVSPACDHLFQALASDPSSYQAAVDELLAGDFSEAKLNETIDRHAAFIASAVEHDPKGAGLSAWQGAVSYLKRQLPLVRAHLGRAKLGLSSKPLMLAAESVTD